ncbi:MAG: SDR family oxidoreductase [Rhodobacteraceae bacterium]|nr:SDR family oxidoreductase [Paracoccaceae bacterium]
MDLNLTGQRVVVTGAASGIGLEIARGFAAEGACVMLCDADRQELAALAGTDPNLIAVPCDVADRDAAGAFITDAAARLGGIDTLVNNAGIAGPTGPVEEIAPEQWDRCLQVCLTGQFNMTRTAVPHLRASANPSIINLSSLAGRVGFALRTPYAAAKWGVIGFTKSLSIELGPDRIRVNAVLPGLVSGDRQRRVLEAKAQRLGKSFAETEAQAFSYTSIRDYVTPGQIADQCLYLASARASTISGQAVSVCGDTQMLA